MADIIGSIVSAVVPYLVAPIQREFGYLSNYHSNVENLKNKFENIEGLRSTVGQFIEAARSRDEEIRQDVEIWLTRVDGIIEKARKLIDEEDNSNKRCFIGLCPNLKLRYQMSKKAKKTAAEVEPEIQDGGKFDKFDGVSYPAPPPRIRITPIEGYEAFESRKPTSKKIMEALRNADVNLIGVYGMGGTGKTVLVKEIARKCEEVKLFDEVVMAVVSQHLDKRKIQGEIADKLNLTLKEETESGRAGRLCEELKKFLMEKKKSVVEKESMEKKKSILVILDDIWEKFDLAEVGIPFGGKHSGCKIVMTSRNQHILSNEMGTQEALSIEVLLKEEAWNLFKKIAGGCIEDHDREPIARGIVEECARLPIAIVTVANALKNKELPIWKDALLQLKKSTPARIKDMHQKVYSTLKWSYDFLQDEEAKSLFLLCSLLPEDYPFSILDILKFGEGVGLFQDVNMLEDERNKVDTLVNTLTDSSLLLHDNTTTGFRMLEIVRDKHFRMHDIVRDVGIYVASNDKHMPIVRNDDEMEEQMRKEKLKDCPAISLPYSDIHELPTGLECPKLTLFLVFSKDVPSLQIPNTFFEGMEQLRVLYLRNMCFSSLPSSLHGRFLPNLRTLCLDDCLFQFIPRHDLARIGELKKLKVLSFASSDIAELPREIGQLTCLRLLDLRNCFKLKVIPPNVIEKFTRLEDLYMENSFVGWGVNGNASLAELKDLSRLVTLGIHIPDTNILPKDLRFENLMRYIIFIGDGWDWYGDYKTSRTLKLKLKYGDYETSRTLKLKLKTSIEQFGLNSLLEKTEDLYLGEMNGNKNGLCSLNREVFPQLRHLHVQEGCEMEYVVNTSELIPDKAFPELRSLFLHKLINLKKICHGQLPAESFCNLRIVEVESCNSLKNLFSLCVVKSLWQLRTLKIKDCEIMDEIISEESEASEGNNEAMGKITFPQLRSLELKWLPKLSSFYSKKQTKRPSVNYAPTIDAGSAEIISEDENDIPLPLFNEKVAFPNLEELVIWDVSSLKEIWPSQLPVDDHSFCKLESLEIGLCNHLLNIVPSNMLMKLQNLELLTVRRCESSVEYIFDVGGLNDSERHVVKATPLRELTLDYLPRLKQIWKTDSQLIGYFSFQNLASLSVSGCHNLRHIFTTSIAKSLVQLQELVITSSRELEEIVEKEGVEKEVMSTIEFPQLTFLFLADLPQLKSFCQGSHISKWPCLKTLILSNCPNVEIFALELSKFEESGGKGHVGTPTKQPLFLVDKVAFPNLEELELTEMSSMKEIWQGHFHAASFGKLTILKVEFCGSLTHLLSFGIAKSLTQIERIFVDNCEMMKEIIASKGGTEAIDETSFSQLISLKLGNLSNLTSFCARNNTFSFPSLEGVLVEKCPKLEIFSYGSLHTPKLEKVHIKSKGYDMGFWKGYLDIRVERRMW